MRFDMKINFNTVSVMFGRNDQLNGTQNQQNQQIQQNLENLQIQQKKEMLKPKDTSDNFFDGQESNQNQNQN